MTISRSRSDSTVQPNAWVHLLDHLADTDSMVQLI
jgi:hypothetical protein